MSYECVNIKGTKHGLIILMDGTRELDELREQLQLKIARNKSFFNGAKFTIHITDADFGPEVYSELQNYCISLGLVYDPQIPYFNNQVAAATDAPQETLVRDTMPQSLSAPPNHFLPALGLTTKEADQQALLVEHNLRSGQKVVYPGNVIVLGDVNPGAEIIAGGNIVVMGTLRGIAHAGASGDFTSTIVAYNLEPTQIRIGERIGRSPDQGTGLLPTAPEIASIVKDQICIEQLGSHQSYRSLQK